MSQLLSQAIPHVMGIHLHQGGTTAKMGASHRNSMSCVQGKPASGRSTHRRPDPTYGVSSPVSGPRFTNVLGAWDCLQVIHQSHTLAAA